MRKPVWLEGMFLRPQHFQQYDRWIEYQREARLEGLAPFSWGIRSLTVSEEGLSLGQFQITAVDAVFEDGTVFRAPEAEFVPPARQITAEHQGKRLFISLAMAAHTGTNISNDAATLHRYVKETASVYDTSDRTQPPAEISVARLNIRLMIEGESMDNQIALPIAEIERVDPLGAVHLSAQYIPPHLFSKASRRMTDIVSEIAALLRARAETLAAGVAGRGGVDRSGMLDLMLLGIVNRYAAEIHHIVDMGLLHPEVIFRSCMGMIGELSAYAAEGRRPESLPRYDHKNLRQTFEDTLRLLRRLLSVVIETNAINIPLMERDYGIWLGEIENRTLFHDRRFILIATAQVTAESLRTQLPIQTKIGPVEQIRDLVNLQLPGIPLTALPVAPREIPYIQNAVYFELDGQNELWRNFMQSAAFALHVSGEYPGLHLELWAIQKSVKS